MKITAAKPAAQAIREIRINAATVRHIIDASRLAGTAEGMAFMAALISQICEFDGKSRTYEEITELPASVFLELSAALVTSGVLPSEEQLSTLSAKADSPMEA